MVRAYHVPLANRGFWLPNDPRGSGSDFVRNPNLLPYGEAKKVTTRRSVARAPHDYQLRRLARESLKYPPVIFNWDQILCIANAFERVSHERGFIIHACALMPAHQHLVVWRHRFLIEQVIRVLRAAATEQLLADGLHPLYQFRENDGTIPTLWGRSPWKVFLNTDEEILGRIDYVEKNPEKEHLPRQHWPFVTPSNLRPLRPTRWKISIRTAC